MLLVKLFNYDLKLTCFAFDIRQSFEAVSRLLKWFLEPVKTHIQWMCY